MSALAAATRATVLALVVALAAPLAVTPSLGALTPQELLDDPALEERARQISAGLRCLVCQNQSIDDSNAPLARDLRLLVRERLLAGDSDEDVIAFVVARYGEYVLLSPRFGLNTLILWGAPVAFLLLGGLIALAVFRRKSADVATAKPLSDDEKARLSKLLQDDQ